MHGSVAKTRGRNEAERERDICSFLFANFQYLGQNFTSIELQMTDEADSQTRQFSSYIFGYWMRVGGIIRRETVGFLINDEEIKGTSFIILVIVQKSPSMSTPCLYLEKKVSFFSSCWFCCFLYQQAAYYFQNIWNAKHNYNWVPWYVCMARCAHLKWLSITQDTTH